MRPFVKLHQGFGLVACRVFLFCVVLWRSCVAGRTCEKITVPMCQHLWYNYTLMPNGLGQQRQYDVMMELDAFQNLVRKRCSPHVLHFLCSVFLPRCTWHRNSGLFVERPCKWRCREIRYDCERYLNRGWPHFLSCDSLPERHCLELSPPTIQDITLPSSSRSSRNRKNNNNDNKNETNSSVVIGFNIYCFLFCLFVVNFVSYVSDKYYYTYINTQKLS